MPEAGRAVAPISPRLDLASRTTLVRALSVYGIPEIGSSAVLNSLLVVLGAAPRTRRYLYREPYPQLPDVDAEAAPVEEGCAEVELTARSKSASTQPVTIKGVYCLVDPANIIWGARSLSVEPR